MDSTRGFSLIEVLVSLLLMTSTLLALLKQQLEVSKVCNQFHSHLTTFILQQDAFETAINKNEDG